MIKTNPHSLIVLWTLSQIQNAREIVLQTEKTDAVFPDSKLSCYLCEVVSNHHYPRTTIEDLVAENIKLSGENRKLRRKLEKMEAQA